jgi:putative phage-type endonuclease
MTYTQLLSAAEARPENPRWHELRREGVTASEIAAVMGISPWNSPFGLYWQKRNGWATDDNPEMAAGRRYEPVVADWYKEVADPLEVFRMERAGLYASLERPWQLATPDRLVYNQCDECDGTGYCRIKRFGYQKTACEDCFGAGFTGPAFATVECKYVIASWDGWGEDSTDIVPVHVRAQAQWQMDVMDVDECHVAAAHMAELRVYVIRRDDGDLRVMRAAAQRFLRRLAEDDPPEIDGHDATLWTLKQLHPDLEDRRQEISPLVADGYRRARALKQRAEVTADLWEARLRNEMGNARLAYCDGRKVASRSVYALGGEHYDLHALDGISPLVDKLTPARSSK